MYPLYPVEKREGDNVDKALVNIQEAIELYLEPMNDDFSLPEGVIVKELVV